MNTIDNDLQRLFTELKLQSSHADGRIYGTGMWESWHQLADAQYQPAKEFFIEKLESPRFDWRRESVSLLGFHYELENEVLEKIHYLLIHDPDEVVRMACAAVLGKQGHLPEKTLIHALALDPDKDVRKSAFFALLDLARLPYKTRLKELKKVESGEITPSLDQVRRILSDENLLDSLNLLNEK